MAFMKTSEILKKQLSYLFRQLHGQKETTNKKTNIVFILSDDAGYAVISVFREANSLKLPILTKFGGKTE